MGEGVVKTKEKREGKSVFGEENCQNEKKELSKREEELSMLIGEIAKTKRWDCQNERRQIRTEKGNCRNENERMAISPSSLKIYSALLAGKIRRGESKN